MPPPPTRPGEARRSLEAIRNDRFRAFCHFRIHGRAAWSTLAWSESSTSFKREHHDADVPTRPLLLRDSGLWRDLLDLEGVALVAES